MPILWRYLLRNYFQVFALCNSCFIAILLITRFQEIARFATTGASKVIVAQFILCQIPEILPLAIPISCLISAILLFQKMSRTHELTALRSSGLGLWSIVFPLMASGVMLALTTFTLVSEIAPKCHGISKGLAYKMAAVNPLCLLQKDTMIKLKNSYVDMKVLKSGRYAKDVIYVMRNLSHHRLGLMIAKELSVEQDSLIGKGVSFISNMDSKQDDGFDHLVVENQTEMTIKSSDLTQFLRSSDWHFNEEYLNLRMLRAKKMASQPTNEKFFNRTNLEISRRISLSLAAFLFTLIGISFGIEIGRKHGKKSIYWATSLAAGFMICFVAAKSMKHSSGAAMLCYLLPHPIILVICLKYLKKIEKGIE